MRRVPTPHHTTAQGHYPIVLIRWLQLTEIGLYLIYPHISYQLGLHPVTAVQNSTHLHTNNTQNNTINLGTVRAVPRLCELYPDICLTTEGKAWINLSQGSQRVPVGTTNIYNNIYNIYNNTLVLKLLLFPVVNSDLTT